VTVDPRALIAAGSVALVIVAIVAGVVVLNDTPAKVPAAAVAEPSAQPGVPRREVSPPVREAMPRDGIYVAGRHIKTGTYTAPGGAFCYWARLKRTPFGTTSLAVSSYAPGEQVATITVGDIFQTSGCGWWVMVR